MPRKNQHSLMELAIKLEKQAGKIALLEEELIAANEALEEKNCFAAQLEQDLEHAIALLQRLSGSQVITSSAH